MRSLILGLLIVAGVAVIEGIYFGVRFVSERKRDELRRRLQSLGTGDARNVSLLREGRLSRSDALDAILRLFSPTARLESLIEEADLPITVAQLLAFCLMAFAAGMAISLVARGGAAVGALLGAALFFVPVIVVHVARDRRSAKLSEQLPEALDMMARSLRAGHAISSSFRLVASEMPEPISLEFGRAYEEQNLGLPLERAVENMTRRVPTNRDLKLYAVSVIVQKETGGNLAEILENIAETIRARYRFFGKLRALTAEGRVSGYILGGLPILTGLVIYLFNPEYSTKLVTDPMGRGFLVYAVVSWCLGFLWMRKMSQVEF